MGAKLIEKHHGFCYCRGGGTWWRGLCTFRWRTDGVSSGHNPESLSEAEQDPGRGACLERLESDG